MCEPCHFKPTVVAFDLNVLHTQHHFTMKRQRSEQELKDMNNLLKIDLEFALLGWFDARNLPSNSAQVMLDAVICEETDGPIVSIFFDTHISEIVRSEISNFEDSIDVLCEEFSEEHDMDYITSDCTFNEEKGYCLICVCVQDKPIVMPIKSVMKLLESAMAA
jgi:hypothetical protein